ncbi:MAG: hypothetical protein HC888_12380 [Candidatus Competibacteraceae bacterium]|nr:hypothetical protein [Candidatus Competibacteraceae bacterium]
MDPFTSGYLASLLASASWAGVSVLGDALEITDALKEKIAELGDQIDSDTLSRAFDPKSFREELGRIAVEVGRDRAAWGITANEKPLFNLLTDPVFQASLANWLEKRELRGSRQAREELERSMDAALKSGGATGDQRTQYLAIYFDLFERHLFANPALAIRRIETLILQGPEARHYAECVAFDREYLKAVKKEYGYIELLGLPSYAQRHPIDAGFISLALRDGNAQLPRPAEQILREYPRLIIEGEAGAGKTTLFQWESVHCCDGVSPMTLRTEKTADPSSCAMEAETEGRLIPFFLKLRRLIKQHGDFPSFPPMDDWLRHSTPYFKKDAPRDWLHTVLTENRALLFLDGLDELPDKKRPDFWNALRELFKHYPHLRFRVSSRYFPRDGEKADQWRPPIDPGTAIKCPPFKCSR